MFELGEYKLTSRHCVVKLLIIKALSSTKSSGKMKLEPSLTDEWLSDNTAKTVVNRDQ